MYDVYLGGVDSSIWRKIFKSQISSDISVFDPYIENLKAKDKSEQIAREFYFMDYCDLIVFYFDISSTKSTRLQLGDAVGNGRQVIVCLEGKVKGKMFLKRYCEYRGVLLTNTLEDLVITVEECAAQLELCKFNKILQVPLPQGDGIAQPTKSEEHEAS